MTPDLARSRVQAWQPPVIRDDYDVYAAMTDVFLATPGGEHYPDPYLEHLPEVLIIGASNPALLWDSYHALQDSVGLTFDDWAAAIGVQPPGERRLFLPVILR